MAIDTIQTLDVIEVMENFMERIRPAEEMRPKLDVSYRIEEQSIIIYEIRPHWEMPGQIIESAIAKTTFVKAKNHWKVFWFRADLKWHAYSPCPVVKELEDFCRLVEEDKHSCFWG